MEVLSLASNGPVSSVGSGMPERTLTCETPRIALLLIHAIIPLSLLAVFIDNVFFQSRLRSHLPSSPETLLLFLIFFNLPHIAASAVTFCDKQYLKHYGSRLLPAALVLAAIAIFFPDLLYTETFFAIYYVWTMVHFSGQQCGLLRMMGGRFGRSFTVWRWMMLLFAVPIYFDMFSHNPLHYAFRQDLRLLIRVSLLAFLGMSYIVWRNAETKHARYYVAATAAGAITEVVLYFMNYFFFVVLVTRVIHDLSAFTFYISHDANRNAGERKNFIHRALRFLPVSVGVLCPVVAMTLAFPLTYGIETAWAYRVWMPIALFHYYTDGFVWKKGSPHRDYIRMR